MKRAGPLLPALLILAAVAAAATGEHLIVGLIVNGREAGSVEVVRTPAGFLLPEGAFFKAAACTVERTPTLTRLRSPLGTLVLAPQDERTLDGVRYITQAFAEKRLGIRFRFDQAEFALRVDLPWNPRARKPGVAPRFGRPEFTPPAFALSTLREDATSQHRNGIDTTLSSTTAGGPLAGGAWRLRLDEDFKGNPRWQEYAWYRRFHRTLLLAGFQRIQLHPVLDSFQMTGVQMAWTNIPLEIFPHSWEARELLPRQLQTVETFRGKGPVGAIAQLRVDGRVISQQTIGLNGQYEFLEVPLRSRQLSRVEILIFDRSNPTVPIAIHEESLQASGYLLPRHAVVQLGGLGAEGNLTDRDSGEPNQGMGFYQIRYGVSRRLTLEGAFQRSRGRPQGALGFVSRLSPGLIAGGSVGGANGRVAYDASLSAIRPPWRLFARSQSKPAGYPVDSFDLRADHYLELGYRPDPKLDVSLTGRQWLQPGEKATFLLPALTWRPGARMSFFARPDQLGDYRLDLWYRATRRARLSVSYQHGTVADLAYDIDRRSKLSLTTQFGEDLAARGAAFYTRTSDDPNKPWWGAGVVGGGGKVGLLASLNWKIYPGVLARVEYEGVTLSALSNESNGYRLLVGITTDFTVTPRGFLPTNSYDIRQNLGGIAGVVRVVGGRQRYTLDGLTVDVDGRPAARTEPGGVFFVGRLSEGLHQIELDTEGLPIELSPVKTVVIAEVAAGAVTSVSFTVRPEYGIAGRVTDAAGRIVEGASLVLLAADGTIAGRAVTDRFGLYRMDGIAPGTYTLKLTALAGGAAAARPPTRTVEVIDDYLFGQDLRLPAAP